jgi:hypothetical protein
MVSTMRNTPWVEGCCGPTFRSRSCVSNSCTAVSGRPYSSSFAVAHALALEDLDLRERVSLRSGKVSSMSSGISSVRGSGWPLKRMPNISAVSRSSQLAARHTVVAVSSVRSSFGSAPSR